MRGLIWIAAVSATVALGGCASQSRIGRNAALGGAGGAAIGAVVPGVSTVEGAAIGAAGGAIVGAIQDDKRKDRDRQWYRDDRGNRYYIDRDGKRRYD